MSCIRLCNVIWLLLVICIRYGQCCGPAEIGQRYTITSPARVPANDWVTWYFDYDRVYYSSFLNPNINPDEFVASRTQLTILNVTKAYASKYVKHSVRYSRVFYCYLKIYKRSSTPTCEPLTLVENQIRTTCTTAEVYPKAKCLFTLLNGGSDRKNITGTSFVTYNHTYPQTGRNKYYSTSCTLQYSVDGLKPGIWTVQINMYPDLTGVSSALGTIGQAANTLQLSVPTVDVNATSCPKGLDGEGDTNVRNGYIRQANRASCLCTLAHAGNPPGTIGWSSTRGGNFANLSLSEESVTIQVNSLDTFTCQSTSVLNGSHSVTYTPKYAYGPSSASLTFQTPGPIYLCPSQQTEVDITCQVPLKSFNPAPLFTIRDGYSNNLVTKAAGDAAWSKSVNFTESGHHIFNCRVENSVFSDIYSEAPATAIQIYAPPTSPPSIQVTGQSVTIDDSETWVKQGSDISVACSVGEAYPTVSSVTMTCGRQTSRTGQLSVSRVNGDELACQCAVDHKTKTPCNGFNLNKQTTIQIAYGPTEVTISFADDQLREVQNSPLNLCNTENLDLTVICGVEQSDVRPGMTIGDFTLTTPDGFTTQQRYLNISGGGDYKSVNKLKVTSGGRHTLVCEARNRHYPDTKKIRSKVIEVRAPPNRPPSFNITGQSVITDNSGTWMKQGSNISVSCLPGEAYPIVSSVTVTCGQKTSPSGQLSVSGVRGDELTCQCAVDHETKTPCKNLNLNNNMTIQTAYGPNEVTISLADSQLREVPITSLNLCSSEGLDLNAICAVKQSYVRPGLTKDDFTLTKPNTFSIKQAYVNTSGGLEYRYVNKLKVSSGGRHTLVCEAKNPKFSDIKQTQSMTIEIREPPKDPPKISARSSKHGDVLMEGDDVTVTCDVSGGYPSVKSVTLTCGQDNSVTSNGTMLQLTFEKIELTCSVINCTCQATHVTGCYNLISDFPLTVTRRNFTMIGVNEEYKGPYTTTDLVGAIIGSIVGTLVLVAAIALIVFFIRRGKAKAKNRNRDRDYDQVEKPQDQRYQNVRLQDPNYLHVNPSGQTPGPKKESAKRKSEHIYSNQVFGDSTDTTNTDFNVYSFIKHE